MARILAVLFDDENYTGMAGLQHLDDRPDIVMLLVPWTLSMLRSDLRENLLAIATALNTVPELVRQAEQILQIPAKTVEANLSGKPEAIQVAARRIIDAAIDGRLRPQLDNYTE